MKKLISIMAVACILVFSCVPAFAEGQYVEGYAVDDVPYNDFADGVLTASNDGSQLYSASSNRTYNTPAVLSATTNSNALYYYSDIYSGLFTSNKDCFRATNMTYKNLGTSVQFNLVDKSLDGKFYSRLQNDLTKIKSGRKYRFTFTIVVDSKVKGDIALKLLNSLDHSLVFTLFFNSAPASSGGYIWANTAVTVDVTIPDSVVNGVYPYLTGNVVKGYTGDVTVAINKFTVTDVTDESLDNAVDKNVEGIGGLGSDEPALDTDISAFQTAIDTMNGWIDQLNEFADSIDSAGETVNEYISKGTELFNGFMGIAPASVIALVAFGVVFLVIRKIVGR